MVGPTPMGTPDFCQKPLFPLGVQLKKNGFPAVWGPEIYRFLFPGGNTVLKSRCLVALLFVIGLGLPARGQDAVDLKWKFEKGKTFYQEVSTETKQDMTIMGMNIAQNQKQTFIFSWTPEQQNDKDKSWTIKQKIEGVKMDIQIGGSPITFDSTKDATSSNPLADFFKAIVGTEFKITLGADGKVSKIDGREEFIKKLVQTNPQMQTLLTQILSDEALKQMADPAFGSVPGHPVKKGDSWERKSTLNMGPIGSYESTYKYTYEGPDEKDKNLHKVKIDTTLKYVPPPPGSSSSLPFKVIKAQLDSKDPTGSLVFDTAKGRVASSNMNIKLEGKLDIEISGQSSEVQLKQSQTTTVKTSDENPVKK
jgi:hypothetical protein